MNEYKLIEFTAQKKITIIQSKSTKLDEILANFYQHKINALFDETGNTKGFIAIFVNARQLSSINNITIKHGDEIKIVTSIAGG